MNLVFSAGGWVYAWMAQRSKAAVAELAAINTRLSAAEQKIHDHETALGNLPTKEAFHALQLAQERMNSDVRVISETMRGVRETSNLMRDWLIKESAK